MKIHIVQVTQISNMQVFWFYGWFLNNQTFALKYSSMMSGRKFGDFQKTNHETDKFEIWVRLKELPYKIGIAMAT